jgi:hypothetical protein
LRATTDLEGLGLDQGGHLLLEHALAALEPGDELTVAGRHPELGIHLAAWCRERGHRLAAESADSCNAGPASTGVPKAPG